MPRLFNTAGPCQPGKHYLLSSLDRAPAILRLIDEERYFVLHAARQTGKTTLLLALAKELEAGGKYRAIYLSAESAHRLDDPAIGIPALVMSLTDMVAAHPVLASAWPSAVPMHEWQAVLRRVLSGLAARSDRPLVLLLDEADCLGGQTLISVLRQLREGFVTRATQPFPQSVALVGMRDIRDFMAMIRPGSETLGSASPFNVVSESLTIRNFNRESIQTLYAQHAADTGQVFPAEVVDLVFEQTQGQPWLVNAIAREIVEKQLNRDWSRPITVEVTQAAIQALILRRDTHLDSLIERLREDRVRKIVEPVILGEERVLDMVSDDVRYCLDLGLLRNEKGVLLPACPVYAEVIARVLSYSSQCAMPLSLEHRWMSESGIDLDGLLTEFQAFWRENSEIWAPRELYPEAAPHLILMAFLQRVLNGGALVTREFASGRKRMDLDLFYAGRHHPIEVKLWRGPKSSAEGKEQIADYCTRLGCQDGWLVFFDQRPERTWDERISWENVEIRDWRIRVVGC